LFVQRANDIASCVNLGALMEAGIMLPKTIMDTFRSTTDASAAAAADDTAGANIDENGDDDADADADTDGAVMPSKEDVPRAAQHVVPTDVNDFFRPVVAAVTTDCMGGGEDACGVLVTSPYPAPLMAMLRFLTEYALEEEMAGFAVAVLAGRTTDIGLYVADKKFKMQRVEKTRNAVVDAIKQGRAHVVLMTETSGQGLSLTPEPGLVLQRNTIVRKQYALGVMPNKEAQFRQASARFARLGYPVQMGPNGRPLPFVVHVVTAVLVTTSGERRLSYSGAAYATLMDRASDTPAPRVVNRVAARFPSAFSARVHDVLRRSKYGVSIANAIRVVLKETLGTGAGADADATDIPVSAVLGEDDDDTDDDDSPPPPPPPPTRRGGKSASPAAGSAGPSAAPARRSAAPRGRPRQQKAPKTSAAVTSPSMAPDDNVAGPALPALSGFAARLGMQYAQRFAK
jgi:hypothetical protein